MNDALIPVRPVLNWELENLRYVIRLRSNDALGIGIFRRPYIYLSNLENWSKIKQGPAAAGPVRVTLGEGLRGRFPRDNVVVVEKTWDRKTELSKIRQRLNNLVQQQLNAASGQADVDRLEHLADFLAEQKPADLPEKLIALFFAQAEKADSAYPDLQPFIPLLGEAAAAPLVQYYDRAPSSARLSILTLSGDIGSATALALVRREIYANNPDLQGAAIVALGKIKGDRAGEELALLLADTRLASPLKVTILLQLKQSDKTGWPTTLLQAALKDPFIFQQLSAIVPDFSVFPERLVWKQLPEIYKQLHSENPGAVLAAQHLVATIRFWNHLSRLYPVLEDLLKVRYDYGRTTDVFGGFVNGGIGPRDDRVVWERGLAIDMLDHIEKNLDDPVMWHSKAYRNHASLLTLLYIENLFTRQGKKIINRPPVKVLLDITVRDAAGTVIAATRRTVVVGRQVALEVKPRLPGYPVPTCAGQLNLDRDNWRLAFTPLTVRLESTTVAVPVSIPFGGACQFDVDRQSQGLKQALSWTLRHIDVH